MDLNKKLWEDEIKARHRWGRYPELVNGEIDKLQLLWNGIDSHNENYHKLVEQIISLEVCNWRFKKSASELTRAIGKLTPLPYEIGHMSSVNQERKRKILTYYLSLQYWLSKSQIRDYFEQRECVSPTLSIFEDGSITRDLVETKLGESTELKILLVERLCLRLKNKLNGFYPDGSVSKRIVDSSKEFIDTEIAKFNCDKRFIDAIDCGGLEFCHHKFFRRLDILIESIGAGKWRDKSTQTKDDGLRLSKEIDEITEPLVEWLDNRDSEFDSILGKRQPDKAFLVSLFVSLLTAQKKRAVDIANYHLTKT